jgi:ADP-ribose pyrophosphatase YjhB (NUDIX family)
VCDSCDRIAYVNPRLVVTTLPITEEGNVVLIRRGIAPSLGLWAQPGGYLEIDETVNQAAIRETYEETGLLVEPGSIVGLYSWLEATVVTLVFEARLIGGDAHPTREATSVTAFRPEEIPWNAIAFETTSWALRDWIATRRPDLAARN